MNSNRDPFGFETRRPSAAGSNAIVVIAQPGQELRIIVPDDAGSGRGTSETRAGGKGSGDSRSSGKGDSGGQDPLAFGTARRGSGASPITIVARPGQEIRIVVSSGPSDVSKIPPGFSLDSRSSGPSHDER